MSIEEKEVRNGKEDQATGNRQLKRLKENQRDFQTARYAPETTILREIVSLKERILFSAIFARNSITKKRFADQG